jgi:hypothetical protein
MDGVLTSFAFPALPAAKGKAVKASTRSESRAGLTLVTDYGTPAADTADQFVVFQLSNQMDGPAILESSQVEPKIDGSRDEPDVLVGVEMLSFQVGESEDIDKNTRATLRLNFGKDESSTDRQFDAAFWSIAAGLSLYDQAKTGRAAGKDLKADFRKAFGGRPIEIPGGLGRLTFEVVKHEEPSWWKRTFRFLVSDTGKSLISVLGFPAITNQAIDVLDQLFDKLTESKPETLFKSKPMRLALSKYARTEFVGGNPRVRMGCLSPGFAFLARGRDFPALSQSDLLYYPTHGKLVPASVSEADLMAGTYDDPLSDVTYVALRIGMRGTRLDPSFNYGS